MQQGVQTDATCNIQQFWELLANNVVSVCTGLYGGNQITQRNFKIQNAATSKNHSLGIHLSKHLKDWRPQRHNHSNTSNPEQERSTA